MTRWVEGGKSLQILKLSPGAAPTFPKARGDFQEAVFMLDFMRRQRSTLKWVWVILIFIFSSTLVTLYIPFGDLPNVSITSDVASIGRDSISSHEFQSAYRNYVDRKRGQLNA